MRGAALTISIVARNSAATIERAIGSCLAEAACPVVLADDHSADATVARAVAVAGPRLKVVRVPDPGGVGLARQCALEAVTTDLAAWLDADDEWIPGRASRLEAMLRAGYDVAVESIDLHDGPSGLFLRRLTTPAFLRVPGGAVRLFERNFLPGDTQIAFRTQMFRDAGGYDPSISGPESFDLLLRALRRGARVAFGDHAGYRMYAYPHSLSRHLSRQRAALATALRKHDYEDVRQAYLASGYGARIAAWALVMMATFRADYDLALTWLDKASPATEVAQIVLEPEGPWPFSEGWRRAFHRGTILLLQGRDLEAAAELERAERFEPTPEAANNRGVALARLGRAEEATRAFASALERSPGYLDATVNLRATAGWSVTTHPLRREASRREYAVACSESPPATTAEPATQHSGPR